MKNTKFPTVVGKCAGILGSITLLVVMNSIPVQAVTDPDYAAEEAEVARAQAQDRAEALAGIRAAQAAAELPGADDSPAPAPEPAPVVIIQKTVQSPSEGGAVLGVSTQRDPLEKAYTQMKQNLDALSGDVDGLHTEFNELKSSAESVREQSFADRGSQNILLAVIAVAIGVVMVFMEVRYVKLAGRLSSFTKRMGIGFKRKKRKK